MDYSLRPADVALVSAVQFDLSRSLWPSLDIHTHIYVKTAGDAMKARSLILQLTRLFRFASMATCISLAFMPPQLPAFSCVCGLESLLFGRTPSPSPLTLEVA